MSETQDNQPAVGATLPPPNPMRTTPPSWRTKMCPLLSVATLRPAEQARIMGADGSKKTVQQSHASVCQGGGCMLFVPQLGVDGRPDGDGACAFTLMPIAINVLTNTHAGIATQLLARFMPPTPAEPTESNT